MSRDLAVTPGAVVARDPVAEVLQYAPTTDTVFARPVLIVPPPIGRFYFLDLRPGRSFTEYAAGRGLQTFMLSWRNPTPGQGSWDLDTYARSVLAAIHAVQEITGSPDVNLIGFCAGGIIATTVLNHLAATGDDRVHSMSYAEGSWWEAWADWVTARSGERQPPPENLGSERHPVLGPAPGLYVRDMVPT